MGWLHRVKVRHLFTREEDWGSIQAAMNAIADILESSPCFMGFDTSDFRDIPRGDHVFRPADYANKLLDSMYDFADKYRIWIE